MRPMPRMRSAANVIIGMGETGLSLARHLRRQGRVFSVVDSRSQPPNLERFRKEFPDVLLVAGEIPRADLVAADKLLVSPGVDLSELGLEAEAGHGRVSSDIDEFARCVNAPVIAVTGTNGKSTVTSLVAELLRAAGRTALAGGNLGPPALDLLQQPPADFYVLELSSFQLELSHELAPAAAVVLNVAPDHLDRHGDFPTYAAIKRRVWDRARVAVVNVDQAEVSPPAGHNAVTYSLVDDEADFHLVEDAGDTWLSGPDGRICAASTLALQGRHNLANSLAALGLVHAVGVAPPDTVSGLQGFSGLPHRCQLVRERRGVRWVDDSKATNVAAAIASVEAAPGPVVLLAGGECKESDLSALAEVASRRISLACLFGRDAGKLERALENVTRTIRCANLDSAVGVAASQAESGTTVLLAPACASFDMFRDYRHRGEAFSEMVMELPA